MFLNNILFIFLISDVYCMSFNLISISRLNLSISFHLHLSLRFASCSWGRFSCYYCCPVTRRQGITFHMVLSWTIINNIILTFFFYLLWWCGCCGPWNSLLSYERRLTQHPHHSSHIVLILVHVASHLSIMDVEQTVRNEKPHDCSDYCRISCLPYAPLVPSGVPPAGKDRE